MKERSAGPSIVAAALLLCWVEPVSCPAQTQGLQNATKSTSTAPDAQHAPLPLAAAPSATALVTTPSSLSLPASLPSTVSPDIERFARQRGLGSSSAMPAIPPPLMRSPASRPQATPAPGARITGTDGPDTTPPSPLFARGPQTGTVRAL